MPEPSPEEPPKGRRLRQRRPTWMAALAALITFLAIYGLYARQQSDARDQGTPESPSGLFIESQAAGTSLTAMGRILGAPTDCTAWLVDPGTASEDSPTPTPAPDTQAYAVTAGRCVGITDTSTIMIDRPLTGVTVEFNAFAPLTSAVSANVVPAQALEVTWASMRGTDLAVLKLGTTYGDLAGAGVRPIRPVGGPAQGDRVLVAGVPTDGIPHEQKYLRGTRCNVGAPADVLEYAWLWEDMITTDCEGIRGGSAGSVAFNVEGQAVGMVTTTSLGADESEACYLDSPCEVKGKGEARIERGRTYVLNVAALGDCFQQGQFRLGGPCDLEGPDSVVPAVAERRAGQPGDQIRVQLTGTVPEGAKVASLKGPLGDVSCEADSSKWTKSVPAAQWSLSLRLPEDEGWVLACVGSPEHPTAVVVQADDTAPDAGRITLSQTPVAGGIAVEPVFDPPNLSGFRWASGPRATMDCATAEGYVTYERIPATIQADDLPATVCLVGIDDAGNESSPASITVE